YIGNGCWNDGDASSGERPRVQSGGCRSVERTGQACRASVESQPRRRPDDVDNPQPDGDDAAAAAAGAADVPLAFTWKGATMKLKHRLEDIGDQLEELAL